MKNTSITLWLTLVLSAGTIENAGAQSGGNAGGRASYGSGGYASGGGRGSIVRLVTYPEVQQDLGFSDEQKEAVRAINRRVYEHEMKMIEELKNPPPPPRAQWHTQRENAALKMLEQARQEIAQTLTPAQMRRLEQVSLQELGAEALSRPDIARALNLSPAQKQKLARINSEAKQQIENSLGVRRGPSSGFQPGQRGSTQREVSAGGTNAFGQASAGTGYSVQKGSESISTIVRESERRMIEEVLTPQQQAKLKELQGTPCPLKPRYVPYVGGGGGGGGNYGGSGGRIR
jgi:hypothetical protein